MLTHRAAVRSVPQLPPGLRWVLLCGAFLVPFGERVPSLVLYRSLTVADVLLAVSVLGAFFLAAFRRDRGGFDVGLGGISGLLALYAACAAVALAGSGILDKGLGIVLRISYFVVLLVGIANIMRDRDLLVKFLGVLALGLIVRLGWETWAAYGIAKQSLSVPLGVSTTNPNELGIVSAIAVGLFFVLGKAWRGPGIPGMWRIGMALVIGAVILTYSRGAILALAAGAGLLLVLHGGWRRILITTAAIFIAVLLRNDVPLLSGWLNQPYLRFVEPDASISYRAELADVALRIAAENPFWGVGPGMFAYEEGMFRLGRYATDPHNMFLLIASEYGLPALLLFLGAVGLVVVRGSAALRRAGDRERAVILGTHAALLAALVAGLTVSFVVNDRLFWIVAGLCLAAARLEERATDEAPAHQAV